MMAALNQMRGIGDIEEGLLPEDPKERALVKQAYEDATYKITASVTGGESSEDEDSEPPCVFFSLFLTS